MSTNYYAHIIPTKERKQKLHDAIEANDFQQVKTLVEEMYGNIEKSYEDNKLLGGTVHLGKRSGGWKFLWNPNVYIQCNGHMEDVNGRRMYVPDPYTAIYFYPLTKKGIKAFIDREDVLIFDEYGEQQDKEEFWQMALKWGYEKDDKGLDAAGYEKDYPDSYRWRCESELVNLLEREGYQFSSWTRSDFYSDGLRFSTSTDFC